MAPPKNVVELFEGLSDGTLRPVMADFIFLQLLTPDDRKTKKMLQADAQLVELQQILKQALGGESRSDTAVLAFRSMLDAEEAEDRRAAVEHARSLLGAIDPVQYPLTAAYALLKIGSALAILSLDAASATELLRESIDSQTRALEILGKNGSKELRCLAHYNLCTAYGSLWETQDEWDQNEEYKAQAIHHGTEAASLMNQGAQSGNRWALTRRILALVLGDGEVAETNPDVRKFVVSLITDFLNSSSAKQATRQERESLQAVLTYEKKRKKTAGR